jgi:hypothetical protein
MPVQRHTHQQWNVGKFNIARPLTTHVPGTIPSNEFDEGFAGPAGQEPYSPPAKPTTLRSVQKRAAPAPVAPSTPDWNVQQPAGMSPVDKLMQQENWQAIINTNRPAIDKLWQRWAGKVLDDNQIEIMLLGREGSLDFYRTYEKFREYEVWRPQYISYYGHEPNAEQVQKVIDTFGTPESFRNFVSFHNQADQAWQKSILNRRITAAELNELIAGRTPQLPSVISYMEV